MYTHVRSVLFTIILVLLADISFSDASVLCVQPIGQPEASYINQVKEAVEEYYRYDVLILNNSPPPQEPSRKSPIKSTAVKGPFQS